MNKNYDVIIICFTDPILDARAINITKTLLKYDRKVALVTPKFEKTPDYINREDYFRCSVNLDQPTHKAQSEFTKSVKKLGLDGKHVLASDYYSLPAAKSIKLKKRANLVYDSREIYSQLNSLKDRHLARKLLEFREKYLVSFVDRMIVTAEEDEVYLKKHFRHSLEYTIIKNLPPELDLKRNDSLREQFKIPDEKLLLLYQGWVLQGRGLDLLLDTVKELDYAELVIIGDGGHLNQLKDKVSQNDIANVHFTGFVPYAELPNYTVSADIGFVLFESDSISYQNALPNKLFEFIQARVPVITTSQNTIRKVVKEHEIGISIGELNKTKIIEAIGDMENKEARQIYIQNIEKIRKDYAYETQEIEILKVFS